MPRRTRLTLALAAAGAAAVLPGAAWAAPSAGDARTAMSAAAATAHHDPVVMAELAGRFSDAEARAVARRTGLRLNSTIPEIGWASYSIPGDVPAAHAALRTDPSVWRIDFRHPGETPSLSFIPRDTIFQQQGTVAAGTLTASWNWHWTITNFPAAWDIARGDGNVRIAVMDSEFDTEHLELKPKLTAGRNFDSGTPEYRTGNVRATPTVLGSLHGSHVAGLVAAVSDNGNGVTGACFDCVVIPYRISLRGGQPGATETTDAKFVNDLTEALVDFAGRTDARVANMSLRTTRLHKPMADAVALALSKGKILVAAAGNDQLSQPGVLEYPAALPGVIGVGATQPDDNIAPFSSNGDFVDISAPGHGILSTWDQRIPPDAQPPVSPPTHGVGFRSQSGTSMASPIVAGLVGLMLQLKPDLTSSEVQGLLEASAVDLGASGKDPVFGAGRIDAVRTLQNVQAYVRPGPPPDTRRRARFFYGCTVAGAKVKVGAPTRARVLRYQRLVCRARTVPALRKVKIEIQRLNARRGWQRIAVLRSKSNGRFRFTVRLRSPGNWTVRAFYAGDGGIRPSGGPPAKLRVRRP